MNNFLLELPFLTTLLIFLVVVLVKILLSIFFIKEPMHWFRFFCLQLANKVNNQNNSAQQQKIAGLLAALVTLSPLLIILWLFESFIEVNWLWQGFLLYFALGSFGLTRSSIKIAKALIANNSDEAKRLIEPLTLRNTNKLSSLGLTKASVEMQLLQTIQQCFTVAFFFFLGGAYAALFFRLLLEMHYSWNIKQRQYQAFGAFVNNMVQLLQWLPTRLFVMFLLLGTIGQHFILNLQKLNKDFFRLDNAIAVHCIALVIGKKTGGVAMYNNEKLRRLSFNNNVLEPTPNDIIYVAKRVNQVLYFSLLLIFIVVFFYIVQLKQ